MSAEEPTVPSTEKDKTEENKTETQKEQTTTEATTTQEQPVATTTTESNNKLLPISSGILLKSIS